MEIILALMALAATPFGAAMLDKPTRGRFVKYVKVHAPTKKEVARKYQSLVAGEVAQVAALEPRSKDHWNADGALQALWQEAFVFLAIKGQETEFNTVLRKMERHEAELKADRDMVGTYERMVQRATDSSSSAYYSYSHTRDVKASLTKYKQRLAREIAIRENEYTPNQRVIRDLIVKYDLKSMEELRYKNDLVRLATGKRLPAFDYVALTAYTVNK